MGEPGPGKAREKEDAREGKNPSKGSFLCDLVKAIPWVGEALSNACAGSERLRAGFAFIVVFGLLYPIICFAVVLTILRYAPGVQPVRDFAASALDLNARENEQIDTANQQIDGTEIFAFELSQKRMTSTADHRLHLAKGQPVRFMTFQREVADPDVVVGKAGACLDDPRAEKPKGTVTAELDATLDQSSFTEALDVPFAKEGSMQPLDPTEGMWKSFQSKASEALPNEVDMELSVTAEKREIPFMEDLIACGRKYEIYVLATYLKPRMVAGP